MKLAFRRMRTVTNMYIANLAIADFILTVLAMPFQFQARHVNSLKGHINETIFKDLVDILESIIYCR
jgi:hypothetical protein